MLVEGAHVTGDEAAASHHLARQVVAVQVATHEGWSAHPDEIPERRVRRG